jgi:xylose dehydrogenase (NAD/NADP)
MKDDKTINFGLIGPGRVADQRLAPALGGSQQARLWSVLGRNGDHTSAFARKHDAKAAQPAFTDLKQFLADPDLDAVLIATPDHLHAEFAIAALESGHAAFIEKPITSNVAEAWPLVDAAVRTGLPAGVCYHLRFHEGLRQMVNMVHNGAVGTPLHMQVRWSYRSPDGTSHWRATTSEGLWSLAAFGTHALDLIRWTLVPMCGEVVLVRGLVSGGVWGTGKDETAIGLLQFASGATAELISSVLFESEPLAEVVGDRGTAVARHAFDPHGTGFIQVCGRPVEFPVVDPYKAEVDDLALCVRERRTPAVNCIEALRNVQILAEIVSSGQGSVISKKAS